jgi:hypothetical protein
MAPRKRARTSGASTSASDLTPTKEGISQEMHDDLIARAKGLSETHGKIVDHVMLKVNEHGGVSSWHPSSACSLLVL